MKESKAVYVTKRDRRYEGSKDKQSYENKIQNSRDTSPQSLRYAQQTQEAGCQCDYKRDNLICTCRHLATIRKKQEKEVRYFGLPKQIYAYHGTRSFTDIGVGSVKALQRKKVKRIYLPETDDRGVGSSDLTSFVNRRNRQQRGNSYYEQKRTSSKCVGGILEYNTGCVMSEKLSPIVQTVSGSTSPRDSTYNRNIEIGSNTVVKSLANTTTQVEEPKKEIEVKPEVKIEEVKPILMVKEIVKEETKEMKSKTLEIIKPSVLKEKDVDKDFSSDSLVQHVHNLENPSDYKPSRTSMEAADPMENKLEREYRKIFANKSKDTKSSNERPMGDFKSTSTLKRRFEALRRGLAKKEDSKKNALNVSDVTSPPSMASRKDVSINSDPPSLEGRSYSSTKPYTPFPTSYSRDKPTYSSRASSHYRRSVTSRKERGSSQWSSRPDDEDSECQGVKGMFKLWGKKFNLEEDYYNKKNPTPKPSYVPPKEPPKRPEKKFPEPKLVIKDDVEVKKDGKRFFFFKKKNKYKDKPYKAKKGVTTGRCEVRDGLMIKIGGGGTSYIPETVVKEPEAVPDDYDDLIRKPWVTKFMSHAIESRNSVQVRWNNKTYATSSSTVFELMDNVYKDTGVVFRSKSQVTVHSSYKSYTAQHVNFVHQNIEAWMVPKTLTDKPKLLPKMRCKSNEDRKDNIEVRISDQKWFIDKSKAFSHKIEVVLHSNNMVKLNKEESSEYLRIDIPKGFFIDSSSDENKNGANQSSDEEVYKIVEYETGSDLKKDKTVRNFDIGDHKQNNIKVTVSVKESKDYDAQYIDTIMKQPPVYKNVSFKGSKVYILKRCDVIGVGIITQRELRDKRKPILKIQDDYSDDEYENQGLRISPTKCELAESYLQEFYRHCTPLGIDSYSWCVSDSHLRCCSENSKASYNNQGDGTKSCPNIYDDFQTATIVSSCAASSCSHCRLYDAESSKPSDKCCKWLGKLLKKKGHDKRTLPKDSIEVFRKRKLYAASDKSKWSCPEYSQSLQNMPPCSQTPCPGMQRPSCESKGGMLIDCPNNKPWSRPVEQKVKKRVCKKHVSLPNCEAMSESLAKRLENVVPSGILAFKGSAGCDACKKKGCCPKHAIIIPQPSCEIPRAACRDSCEKMKNPPCAKSKTSCEHPGPLTCPGACPTSKKGSCPPSPAIKPPTPKHSRSCPPSPPHKKKSCPSPPHSKKSKSPCPSPPHSKRSKSPCPSPPFFRKLPSCPSTPTRSKKHHTSCPPSPARRPPSRPATPPCKRPQSPPSSSPPCMRRSPRSPSPPSSPPLRPIFPYRSPPASPPPCRRSPPCPSTPPSPPPCRRPGLSPPSSPPCKRTSPSSSPSSSPPPCMRRPASRSPPGSPPSRRPPSCPPSPHKKQSCPPTPQPCKRAPACPSPPNKKPPTCPSSPPPCRTPHSLPSCPHIPPSCPHSPPCPPPPPPCPHIPPCPLPPLSGTNTPPTPPRSCPHSPKCVAHSPPSSPHQRTRPPSPSPPCPYAPACSSPPPCPYIPPPCLYIPPCYQKPPSTPGHKPSSLSPPCARRKSPKQCPASPPACPTSPPSCCSVDPNRCPALPHPCKKSSKGICQKLSPFFRKKPPCPSSPPCKPTPCKPSHCKTLGCQQSPLNTPPSKRPIPSPCQKFSMTSCSYGSMKHRGPEPPYVYSPVHPCPPEQDKPKKAASPCKTPPCNKNRPKYRQPSFDCQANPDASNQGPYSRPQCDPCFTSAEEFPWPTKNQVSNQSSMSSLYQSQNQPKEELAYGCTKKCPNMHKEAAGDEPPPPKKDCKKSCPNRKGSPRPPCIPEMKCPPPRSTASCTEPRQTPAEPVRCRSKSKMSGLFLKMKPVPPHKKKAVCSKDCLAWESQQQDDGCISLNSEEKITIRLKKDTPSTDELREGLNIKVQDEDGMTLFERKDYRLQHAGMNRPEVLGDMYRTSEVRRVTTAKSVKDLSEGKNSPKQMVEGNSDVSIANLIEIQFKLKVTQGEKTTEINIANDGDKENEDDKLDILEPVNKSPQEIFVLKNGSENPEIHSDPKNDINIRIVIKNFKPKSGVNKSVKPKREDYSKDFAKKISAKFHTVSTGYSDVLHDDNVFSVHRATVDLTSSIEKSKTHSNKSEEIMSETLSGHGKGRSAPSICRCVMTDMSDCKIDYEDLKSISSRKYSTNRHTDTQEETVTTDTDNKPAHKYDTETEDSDKQTDQKYDTEETDGEKLPENKYDTEETDTDKHTAPKYDTFLSTEQESTTDQEPIAEEDTYNAKPKSIEVIIKPHTKDEKKEMLKQVFEKAHETKTKNKTRMRKLRDMLKVILTSDSSDHDDGKSVRPNDLAKDVTYASLKPNYFRDSDSMNNYYRTDSHTQLSAEINPQVVYPSVENNSDCSNSNQSEAFSSENESTNRGCMCSTLAARLKLASRIGEGGGCCCGTKTINKKNEETTCDLKKGSDYFQYEYKQLDYVDVETQNSNYLISKINSTNLSTNKSIKSSILGDTDTIRTNSGVINVDQKKFTVKKVSHHHRRECEMRKFNRNTILSISDDDKIILLSSKPTRVSAECAKCKIKERKKKMKDPLSLLKASDILQSYETKKAVLEIYTEKTISNDGEHLVAKLPKFVYDRESEIETNYEAIANDADSICKRNIVMMAITR